MSRAEGRPAAALSALERLWSQYVDAHAARARARVLAARGTEGVDTAYRRAAARFHELGVPFWLAVMLLEHAEWLGDGEATELSAEDRKTFAELSATPWIARADALLARPAEVA